MTVKPGAAVHLGVAITLEQHRAKHADPRQRPETQGPIKRRISDFVATPDLDSPTWFGVAIPQEPSR